jgi:TPP-dependent pyruvate/acetoin dehydrogenase alpha subunit
MSFKSKYTYKENKELVIRLFRSLYRIRRVELEIARLYPTDVIKSPVHLSLGQESISVGVCDVLRLSDVVFGTYRGHANYLAKGGNLNSMIAELYGKIDGCCQGKGGSMHLIDLSVHMMGTSAIVASSISEAVGYALALQYKGSDQIVVCFFGDGATGEGAFHESLNFASLKKLPILFICENNNYAIHSKLSERSSQIDLYKFSEVHNITSHVLKKCDIFELHALSAAVVKEIRSGGGPQFIEVHTYRWVEHVGPNDDWHLKYRSKDEIKQFKKNDQVKRLSRLIPEKIQEKIKKEIKNEVLEAIEFAKKSQFPDGKELYKNVYK